MDDRNRDLQRVRLRSVLAAWLAVWAMGAGPAAAQSPYEPFYAHTEDYIAIQRSELIVVGRIQAGSIVNASGVASPPTPMGAHSIIVHGEHRGRLIVEDILKGELADNELTIAIHYWLHPIPKRVGYLYNRKGKRFDYPKTIYQLGVHLMSFGGPPPILIDDLTDDAIWLLRRRSQISDSRPSDDDLGVSSLDDVRDLRDKEYILAYLSPDPEKALAEIIQKDPVVANRAQDYLDHLAIQRISRIENANERAARLIPYFRMPIPGPLVTHGRMVSYDRARHREVQEAILATGEAAVPHLIEAYESPDCEELRPEILQMLQPLKSKQAVDFLARHGRRAR